MNGLVGLHACVWICAGGWYVHVCCRSAHVWRLEDNFSVALHKTPPYFIDHASYGTRVHCRLGWLASENQGAILSLPPQHQDY